MPDASAMFIAIAGMAAVTYLGRAGGLVIARVLPPTPFATAFLKHLGTSVIVALVTATMARGDWTGVVAIGATILLAATGRPTLGLVAGMAAAAILRAWS